MAMCAFTYNILGAPYYTSYTPKNPILIIKARTLNPHNTP